MKAQDWSKYFPLTKRNFWKRVTERMDKIEEIRIRVDRPIIIHEKGRERYLDTQGEYIEDILKGEKMGYRQIQELVDYWCQDSRYAYQKELKNGYLTLKGGHRIGICGEVVITEMGELQMIKNISGLNIRVAHECKDAGRKVISHLYEKGKLQNTLLISAPGGGKTTLLRDLVRRISDGNTFSAGKKVGLVDERGELAACMQGVPQLDVGIRTDVMDGCPKKMGMMRLLRSMSPEVIAIDELGDEEEVEALYKMTGCGCSILATMHGSGIDEVKSKRIMRRLAEDRIFGRIFFLEREEGNFHTYLYQEGDKACYIY